MIIRNKFNGYGRDGIRLYFDPATIVAIGSAGMTAPAVAAPVVAGAGTGLAAAGAATGTAAAQTAALELAKQQAIQAGMQQVGVQAGKTAALEASKKGIIDASMQQLAQQAGTQVAQQSAVEAGKQGIAQGFQKMIPQAADEVAGLATQGAGGSSYVPSGSTPIPSYATPASPAPVATTPPPAENVPPIVEAKPYIPGQPDATRPFTADQMMQNELRQSAARTAERVATEEAAEKLAADPLRQGISKGVELVKKYPEYAGMAAMGIGQYMNQPEEEDKGKYKNKVDMSEFQPSLPSVGAFKPSYEYQKYAIGGPVETMAAQNAVGANTGYPMAGINTAMYSNPMVQRPEAVNVISPSGDAGVSAYSGEPKFAEGGISEEMAREYGLKTRKQRAVKSLTKDYEEMEAERNREATAFANSVNINSEVNPKIIRRSRTQELSSPYSAAIEEHNRLAKKTKTPQFQQPKTSLGDIDTYMDVPVELAARGGIMGNLGSYSDGGRLLRGPGDGVSDSIPAVIGKRQPARLADGEFVIPARIVSELGNGSTEAGARKLYAMMERIQNTRKKSIGKKKVAVNSRADKHLPA